MSRKGFTLVELLGVLVILAVLALLIVPVVNKNFRESTADLEAAQIKNIKDAAKNWAADHTSSLPDTEGGTVTVTVGELQKGGYLDENLTNPKTKEKIDPYSNVIITYEDGNYVYSTHFVDASVTEKYANNILAKKNVSGNTDGLFQDEAGNIRYRGNNSNVKNYVSFNNEVWRIIGVFNRKLKLIRDDRIPNPSNSSHPKDFLWNVQEKNDWATSDLQGYLNGNYYNSFQSDYKNMIEDEKYYLGGLESTTIFKNEAYELERGTNVSFGRPVEWTGKVGLMYPSDYGYASDLSCTNNLYDYNNASCKNTNWLYKSGYSYWTITMYPGNWYGMLYISSDGRVGAGTVNADWYAVHPVFYLKEKVKITGGNGTSASPYQLSL